MRQCRAPSRRGKELAPQPVPLRSPERSSPTFVPRDRDGAVRPHGRPPHRRQAAGRGGVEPRCPSIEIGGAAGVTMRCRHSLRGRHREAVP